MKKLLIAAAALTAFAGIAHAQSSVTLYGALDTAIGYYNNVMPNSRAYGPTTPASGKWIGEQAGNLSPNLWGLRGTEDLGNGLHALFDVESGFNLGTGKSAQEGQLFGRQAWVGLQSKEMGTVTLGRQYDSSIDLVQPVTNDGNFGSVFATPGDIDNYDNSYRTNNSIKYASPIVQGLQVSGTYGFSNQAGQAGEGQTIAGAVAYNNGPLGLAASYFRSTNNVSALTSSFDEFNGNYDSAVISGDYSSAQSTQIIRAAGDYSIGPVTAGLAYSNVAYRNYDGATNLTAFNTGQGFVDFQATPVLLLGVGYDYTKGYGNSVNVAYNQVSLGAVYSLSKRTAFYVEGGVQHTTGKTWEDGVLTYAPASMGDFGMDSDKRTQGMALVGIRHNF